MSRYSKLKIGDTAELHHTITAADFRKFVELCGDDNRLHIDDDFASKTPFKKPVAHGMLGASFISTLIGTKLPGDGALWFSQNLEFLLPVRIGDKLTIKAEVLKKFDRQNSIELQTDIFNQNKQKVTTGVARVKIIENEAPSPEVATCIDKVALIIGSTGGIGSATSKVLAKAGFVLILHYHSDYQKAARLLEEISALRTRRLSQSNRISVMKPQSRI